MEGPRLRGFRRRLRERRGPSARGDAAGGHRGPGRRRPCPGPCRSSGTGAWNGWSGSTRTESACGRCSLVPSTAPDGRGTPSAPTNGLGCCSPTSSGLVPDPVSGLLRHGYSATTPLWAGRQQGAPSRPNCSQDARCWVGTARWSGCVRRGGVPFAGGPAPSSSEARRAAVAVPWPLPWPRRSPGTAPWSGTPGRIPPARLETASTRVRGPLATGLHSWSQTTSRSGGTRRSSSSSRVTSPT